MQEVPSTKHSFLKLISENRIVIPHLQRDYAQGRKAESEKLIAFVRFLRDALVQERHVNLDFVFGYYEDCNNHNSFVPIDGQQRLTTVFLLHWFLAFQSDNYAKFQQSMTIEGESKFTYQTRISSQEFINTIIRKGLRPEALLQKDKSISEIIENSGWFYKPWKEDSTVQAMINAIDTINVVFEGIDNLEHLYGRLEDGLISFEFLNPRAIELSDEFYIKMNARGLPLTPFENFKADLLDILTEMSIGKKGEFAEKLDGSWSDAIWNWSIRCKNTYDNSFKNVFDFLFQMYYSKTNEPELASKYNMNRSYRGLLSEENLDFISKVLDLIVELDKAYGEREQENQKLYEKYSSLFNTNSLGHHEKLRLYGILLYQTKYGIKSSNDINLGDLIRIIDNVLTNTNQSNKREFATDLRTSRYKELIEFIDDLVSKEEPYESLIQLSNKNEVIMHEVEKAKLIADEPSVKQEVQRLENHPYINGCLKNFLFLFENPADARRNVDIFYSLWNTENNNDLKLYKALFSFGDYVVDVGGSGLGRVYFPGSHGKWNRVLANTNKETSRQIQVFRRVFEHLQHVEPEGVLETLNSIPLPQTGSWRYYLASYSNVLQGHDLFAFNEYDVSSARIELLTGAILSTDHTGFLNRAVIKELERLNIPLDMPVYSYSNNVSWSSIRIGSTSMVFTGEKWKITTDVDFSEETVFSIIPIEETSNQYLYGSNNSDLVQQLVALISKYFSSEN